MSNHKLILDGESLRVDDVLNLTADPELAVEISPAALVRVEAAADFLATESKKRVIYGVNTGFGPMVSHLIGRNQLLDLQTNLVRSHAAGAGAPLKPEFVLATMVTRLNTLLKGNSGASPELLNTLVAFINHRILPVVPEHGAVGTSGDLVQLAHLALTLIGEGEVFYKGERQPTEPLLERLEIEPHRLRVKEGLALINGTSAMTGIAVATFGQIRSSFNLSLRAGAWAMELAGAFTDSLDERLHALRPHPGQVSVARQLRRLTAGSKLLRDREKFQAEYQLNDEVRQIKENGQDVYSLRCLPQILGPVLEAIEQTEKVLDTELNAVTDNPLVLPGDKVFLHGGNFHGDYVAAAVDHLKASLVKATMLAERQINYLMTARLNNRFPPFLNLKTPGLTLGLQGLQFVATSTTARSQSLAYPHHLHSITTNGDNQDVVSMGTDAALLAAQVVEHSLIVLAIELLSLAQATDCRQVDKELSPETLRLYKLIRAVSPAVVDDRTLAPDLVKIQDLIASQSDYFTTA